MQQESFPGSRTGNTSGLGSLESLVYLLEYYPESRVCRAEAHQSMYTPLHTTKYTPILSTPVHVYASYTPPNILQA